MQKCQNCNELIGAKELYIFNTIQKDEVLSNIRDIEEIIVCPICGEDYC